MNFDLRSDETTKQILRSAQRLSHLKNQILSIFKKTMYGAIQRGQDEGIKMPPTGMT